MTDPKGVLTRLREVRNEIKYLEKIEKDILSELADVEYDDYILEDGTIATAQPNIRFNAATAKKNLSPEQFKAICKLTPNAALAKALLDDDYYLCQSVTGTKFTFKNPDN